MTIEPGRQVGNYHIEHHLGAGAFATVWLAHDVVLEAPVAIKVLADNWARDPQIRTRFIDEAKLLRRIDDDHVVRVFTVDELPDGRPYFVMAFADRGTLHDRMAARAPHARWSVADAVECTIELAACLEVVHDLGVVHRDLKPSNVLFRSVRGRASRGSGRGERVVLGDFGLAKDLARASGFTHAAGTPAYMAPEQTRPTTQLDHRADLYSATAVLFELLTGHPPVKVETPSGQHVVTASSVDITLANLHDRFPPALTAVLRQGLATDPNDRFASATELIQRLRPILDAARASDAGLSASRGSRSASSGAAASPSTGEQLAEASPEGEELRGQVSALISMLAEEIAGPLRAALWRPFTVAIVGPGESAGVVQSTLEERIEAIRITRELPASMRGSELPDVVVAVVDPDPQAREASLDRLADELYESVAGPVVLTAVADETSTSDLTGVVDVIERVAGRGDEIRASAVMALLDRLANRTPSGLWNGGGVEDASVASHEGRDWGTVVDRIRVLCSTYPVIDELMVVRDEVAGRLAVPAQLRGALREILLFQRPASSLPAEGTGQCPIDPLPVTRALVEQDLAMWRRYQGSGRASFATRTAVEVVIAALERHWSTV